MTLVAVVDIPGRLKALLNAARPTAAPPDWYRVDNEDGGGDTAELAIYSEIGGWFEDDVTASSFAAALGQVTAKNLTVRMSSPGGSVFEGLAIANLIRSHPANVTVVVDGIAASIASVIAMAGDTVIMQPQSQLMIHDALALAIGNAADMRETADLLDRQSDNIARAYAARAGGRYDSWRNKMRAETWYSDTEAVAAGLADRVAQYPSKATVDGAPAEGEPATAARWDLSIYRYAGRENAPAPTDLDRAADGATARKTAPAAPAQAGASAAADPAAPAPAPLAFGRRTPAQTRTFVFGRGGHT